MTAVYDEPPLTEVVQAAAVIVAAHRDGPCEQCQPAGCPEMAWAGPLVAEDQTRWLEAARSA